MAGEEPEAGSGGIKEGGEAMKTKRIILEIPVFCELCCEDCDHEECTTGPVVIGAAPEQKNTVSIKARAEYEDGDLWADTINVRGGVPCVIVIKAKDHAKIKGKKP